MRIILGTAVLVLVAGCGAPSVKKPATGNGYDCHLMNVDAARQILGTRRVMALTTEDPEVNGPAPTVGCEIVSPTSHASLTVEVTADLVLEGPPTDATYVDLQAIVVSAS